MLLQAVTFALAFEADTHSVLADTGAREALLRRAVINVTCSTVEPLRLLKTRHGPLVRVRGTMTSNHHALRTALSRQSLANPCVLDIPSKFCPQAQCCVGARVSDQDKPARLF